jgi:Putative zinc-finger
VSDEKTSLTAALRHLAEQERRTPSEHATPGDLAAYHEGTLSEPVEARVREHLAHCKLCSDLLLDLAGLADLAPPPGIPELTDAEVEEDWQKLRRRLGGEVDKVIPFRPPAPEPEPGPVESPRRRRRWRYAAAAALFVVAVGVTNWWLIPNAPGQEYTFDQGANTRGPEAESLKHISPPDSATFRFYPMEDYTGYEGKILHNGNVVWKTSDVQINQSSGDRTVSFRVPGDSLEPGVYQVVLYGLVAENPPQFVGRFNLEVDAP